MVSLLSKSSIFITVPEIENLFDFATEFRDFSMEFQMRIVCMIFFIVFFKYVHFHYLIKLILHRWKCHVTLKKVWVIESFHYFEISLAKKSLIYLRSLSVCQDSKIRLDNEGGRIFFLSYEKQIELIQEDNSVTRRVVFTIFLLVFFLQCRNLHPIEL